MSWLSKIQNSEDKVKRRWVIGASAVAVVLVVILWAIYFNSTIKAPEESVATEENNSVNAESAKDFLPVFKNGLSAINDTIKEQMDRLIGEIKNEKSITIER